MNSPSLPVNQRHVGSLDSNTNCRRLTVPQGTIRTYSVTHFTPTHMVVVCVPVRLIC